MKATIFANRHEAGKLLAHALADVQKLQKLRPVILALPRGGVPVAAPVADALQAPLDVIIVRKIGVPSQPEVAMGAVGEDGASVRDEHLIRMLGITDEAFDAIYLNELGEVERRSRRYRGSRPMIDIRGRNVIIVDDGIATGSTALAAVRVARTRGAASITIATPVCSPEARRLILYEADDLIALQTPSNLLAVGYYYDDFRATQDQEVENILEANSHRGPDGSHDPHEHDRHQHDPHNAQNPGARAGVLPTDEGVELTIDNVVLDGHLCVPHDPVGVVIFAHGSGSDWHSPRNRLVSDVLVDAGIATLRFDLLTPEEAAHRTLEFAFDVQAARLRAAATWVRNDARVESLPVGYFGASTGAAIALIAAADAPGEVAAIVSRGGRPDLAGHNLRQVEAPTLLIVGGEDTDVLGLNQQASRELAGEHRVLIIPGATHLFEEPGTLAAAADAARDWFVGHFVPGT